MNFPVPDSIRLGLPRVVTPQRAQLGEGLCWSPSRRAIYWVDILGRQLMRLEPGTGVTRTWEFDETISAVAEREHGAGLIVSLQRRIALFDPDTGALQPLPEAEPEHPGNRFNDGKCDPRGRFWACSMDFDCVAPTGSLYRVNGGSPMPGVERAWHARFPVVNGPAWSADGRILWLNDTVRGIVHAFDFEPGRGEVSNPREWLRFAADEGVPDGMTTDAQGRLWIAHWGAARVTCRDPRDGSEIARIPLPASNVTNVAFGGTELTTLYITTASTGLDDAQRAQQPLAGALFEVETNVRGVAPARFAG